MRCWATKSCSRGKGNLCLHQGWDRLLRGVVWDTWREESEGHRPQWWLTFDTQSPALWPESYCLQLATYQVCDITRASTLSTISGCLESCSCWSFQWGKFLTYEIIYFSNVDGDGGRPCLWPDDCKRGLLEEMTYFSCQLSREKKTKQFSLQMIILTSKCFGKRACIPVSSVLSFWFFTWSQIEAIFFVVYQSSKYDLSVDFNIT